LDIPAYNEYDTWIVSLHDGTKKAGNAIGYAKTAVLKDVVFESDPKVALDIARRKQLGSGERMGKATIARAFGDWVPHDPTKAREYAESVFDDPDWVQVGMNPYRASYFYDKADGMPVVAADEIVQVGPLVLAKNVKKAEPTDAKFKIDPKDPDSDTFKKGGVVMPNKPVSKIKMPVGMAKGGLAEGGMLQEGGTVDEESGNDVPVGAMKEEVRDDIPAKLSEGEFVFPADVVRYIGLERLMMMRQAAKEGLKKIAEECKRRKIDKIIYGNINKRVAKLRVDAEIPWRQNGHRKAYISYAMALTRDAAEVAEQCGNSAQEIQRTYKGLTSKTIAEQWFKVIDTPGIEAKLY
jgi:hypothetical protein